MSVESAVCVPKCPAFNTANIASYPTALGEPDYTAISASEFAAQCCSFFATVATAKYDTKQPAELIAQLATFFVSNHPALLRA